MANDLSALVPKLFARALTVLRGTHVAPRVVNTAFDPVPASFGKIVNVPVSQAMTVVNITAGHLPVAGEDVTPTTIPVEINNHKGVRMSLGDFERGSIADNPQLLERQTDEAMKSIVNAINADLWSAALESSTLVGTPGTTPFASDLTAYKLARIKLNQALANTDDRHVILDPLAEGNATMLAAFLQADQRGDQGGILRGEIGFKIGSTWWMDQQIPTHTAGTITTGLAAKTSTAQAVGLKAIVATTASATGAAALKKGDILAIAGSTTPHVLTADATQAAAATDVTLNIEPGLVVALTGGEAITVTHASHVVNIAMHRDAIAFASAPFAPSLTPNAVIFQTPDPQTGLGLRLEISRQTGQDQFTWDIQWGKKLVRRDLLVRIAG